MADTELPDLPARATPALTDIAYLVSDPIGTPVDHHGTLADILKLTGPRSVSVLTSGTAATYTVPAGINRLKVRAQGPGGGGGGGDGGSSQVGVGRGGYAGAYAEKIYSVTPGQTLTYTVPAGGAGGAAGNNAGTDGGNTLFDEGGSVVTAPGGTGGTSMAAGTTLTVTGASTLLLATGGDLNLPTMPAQRGVRLSGTSWIPSRGASCLLGAGGNDGFNAAGSAGEGYGAGGGGGSSDSVTDRAGGAGAPGVIVVEEYP